MVIRTTIETDKIAFDAVHEVEILKCLDRLSNTARVVLPRHFTQVKNKKGKDESMEERNILDYLEVGHPITIKAGYDDKQNDEFVGYITRISADTPLVLECEDEMYKLRNTTYSQTIEDCTLSRLLGTIVPDYITDLLEDFGLDVFTVQNQSAYHILEQLRRNYLLLTTFETKEGATDPTLKVGYRHQMKNGRNPIIYHLEKNVVSAKELEFVREKDSKLRVQGVSKNKDGTRSVENEGETGGIARILRFVNIATNELKSITRNVHKSLSYDGYKGHITTFGEPYVQPGDKAKVIDPAYPNSQREGTYLVESVHTTISEATGFRRKVGLGMKL